MLYFLVILIFVSQISSAMENLESNTNKTFVEDCIEKDNPWILLEENISPNKRRSEFH